MRLSVERFPVGLCAFAAIPLQRGAREFTGRPVDAANPN